MGSRTVLFCDWCEETATTEREDLLALAGWGESADGSCLLCPPCKAAERHALDEVRKACEACRAKK